MGLNPCSDCLTVFDIRFFSYRQDDTVKVPGICMAAPKMTFADVMISGLDTVRTYIFLYLISFGLVYFGFRQMFYGELGFGIFLMLMGLMILIVGLVGMVTKMIGDGVSWGLYANRGNLSAGSNSVEQEVSEKSNFNSRASDVLQDTNPSQFGTYPQSKQSQKEPDLPPGTKKCKECETLNDSTIHSRCYVCQGQLI